MKRKASQIGVYLKPDTDSSCMIVEYNLQHRVFVIIMSDSSLDIAHLDIMNKTLHISDSFTFLFWKIIARNIYNYIIIEINFYQFQ